MKILITGATGNLGQKIGLELVQQGHNIVIVSRSKKSAKEKLNYPAVVICKNLTTDALTTEDFLGIDAVIHLMGESIDGRWVKEKKYEILNSRVQSSKNLLKNMPETVHTVISASAQGYYGDCGETMLLETEKKGEGFLAEVCDQWEAPFRKIKQRAVQLRTGLILDSHSGALRKMISIFQKNLGAELGDGKQFMSWISMQDIVSVVIHLLNSQSLNGPVNCATASPVTNSDFTKYLCQALGVLQLPNIPRWMLKLLFGEMSSIMTDSIKMNVQKLINSGFKFKDPDLKTYFKNEFLAVGQRP